MRDDTRRLWILFAGIAACRKLRLPATPTGATPVMRVEMFSTVCMCADLSNKVTMLDRQAGYDSKKTSDFCDFGKIRFVRCLSLNLRPERQLTFGLACRYISSVRGHET